MIWRLTYASSDRASYGVAGVGTGLDSIASDTVGLSAHQREMREQAADARARHRDHPDRHRRVAPWLVRFADEDVGEVPRAQLAMQREELVERRRERDRRRRRGCG